MFPPNCLIGFLAMARIFRGSERYDLSSAKEDGLSRTGFSAQYPLDFDPSEPVGTLKDTLEDKVAKCYLVFWR
jgi:hypothetical protein